MVTPESGGYIIQTLEKKIRGSQMLVELIFVGFNVWTKFHTPPHRQLFNLYTEMYKCQYMVVGDCHPVKYYVIRHLKVSFNICIKHFVHFWLFLNVLHKYS